MSGTTPMQVVELTKFTGINLSDSSRSITPDQFVQLTNFNTDKNSIQQDFADAVLDMPVPKTMYNSIGDYYSEVAISGTWLATGGYAPAWTIGIPSAITAGDMISYIVPRTKDVTGASATAGYYRSGNFIVYKGLSATASPGPDTGLRLDNDIKYHNFLPFGSATSAEPTGVMYEIYDSMIFYGGFSAATAWYVFNGLTATAGTADAGSASGMSATAGSGLGGTFSTTANRWACCITKNSESSSGGHVLNIYPIVTNSELAQRRVVGYDASSSRYQLLASKKIPFSRMYHPGDIGKKSIYPYTLSGSYLWTNNIANIPASATALTASFYPDFNIVEAGNYFFLTNPNNRNCQILDFNRTNESSSNSTYPQQRFNRKRTACYFNGYIVVARNGFPVSLKLSAALETTVGYPFGNWQTEVLSSCPVANPKFVVAYNNYLMFFNVRLLQDVNTLHPHRGYFSKAGTVNDWGGISTTQFENMSDGEEIIGVEEWFGSLIIFFPSKIKRYTGTPGNASLETIFYRGPVGTECIYKTGRGIFFVSTDGLYLYNGSFNRIGDSSTKFDQVNVVNANIDGWLSFNSKDQELYFYPGYSQYIHVWNAEKNFFRTLDYAGYGVTGGLRTFEYYDNLDLKAAISYPGITHVSKIFGGTTCKPATAQSGWLDLDPSHIQKRFDRCAIDYYGTSAFGTFDFTVTFDDGATAGVTQIPLSGTGIKTFQLPLNRQAKLVQHTIVAPAQTAQTTINSIKYFFTPEMAK